MTKISTQEVNRKLLHLSSLVYPMFYWVFCSKIQMLFVTGFIFIFILSIDFLRKKNQKINIIFCKCFKLLLRDKEKSSFTGSTYFMLGTFLTILLFPKSIAIVGLCVLIVSDTCASIFGILYGTKKICGKSLEGSVAFVISAIIISYFGYIFFQLPLNYGILAAIVAMIAELVSSKIKVDDNVLIPIAYSLTFFLLL